MILNIDYDEIYNLAQNIESAHFRVAQIRQVLLDRSMLWEWQRLIEASSTLDTAQSRLVEIMMPRQGES